MALIYKAHRYNKRLILFLQTIRYFQRLQEFRRYPTSLPNNPIFQIEYLKFFSKSHVLFVTFMFYFL